MRLKPHPHKGSQFWYSLPFICVQLELRSAAKTLVAAETGTVPTYFEYMNLFFAIAFWPIGIWSLQPKINRWYEENKNEFMPRKAGPE